MKRILFSADGSSGDLLPMVLMAQTFQAAGYEVCVCGPSEFSRMAQDFGVPYEPFPINYSELYLEGHRTGYIQNIRSAITHREKLFQGEFDVLTKVAPDYDVLINFLADVFVPSIAEAFNLVNFKLFTFPVVRSDRYGPPAGLPFATENKWLNRLAWRAAIIAGRRFSYFRTVNRLRGELGLPPTRDMLGDNSRCDHMMIGLYEELMPACESWQFDYSYIGPVLPRTQVLLSDELEHFLAAGPKPVYIGFGSMRHADSERITRTLIQSARDAGVRTILAQATSRLGEGLENTDDVFVLREYPIPHHVLFPRLKAAVHHGSWITTHLAAQAGIPQLVLPQAVDQFLWAHIVAKRGLGPQGVDMNRLSEQRLSRAIEQLTQRPEFDANARALGERVADIDGAKKRPRAVRAARGNPSRVARAAP